MLTWTQLVFSLAEVAEDTLDPHSQEGDISRNDFQKNQTGITEKMSSKFWNIWSVERAYLENWCESRCECSYVSYFIGHRKGLELIKCDNWSQSLGWYWIAHSLWQYHRKKTWPYTSHWQRLSIKIFLQTIVCGSSWSMSSSKTGPSINQCIITE